MKLNLINAGKVFNIRWCMSYDYEINMRGLKNYLTWKLFAFIFLNWDHVIHIFQNIYVRPFLMIYLSSNYYFRALLFWNRNPFLETNSSLVLGNFFRENKHDLKRFVVYLEVDNMGKHFFFVPIGFELQTDWSDDIFCPGVSFFDTNSKTFRVIWIA